MSRRDEDEESSPRRIGRDGITPLCILREAESAYLSTAEDMRDILQLKIYKIDRKTASPTKKNKSENISLLDILCFLIL